MTRDEPEKPALEADDALRAPGSSARAAAGVVTLLPAARADARGVVYRRAAQSFLLPWSGIVAAHAAEVGEPEGVQTVVFDLVLGGREARRCRLDADPGAPARELGQAIERGVGRVRCSPSLRAVALEGYATRSYPDLDAYEADVPGDLLRTAS